MPMNKRPIDLMRSAAGSFRVGLDEDGDAITELFSLNDGLVVVKQKAIYEVRFADQIDPKRENPNIPLNIQRRILSIGADSTVVGRTLLTAKGLFQTKYLPSIDCDRALNLSFEALQDIVAMDLRPPNTTVLRPKKSRLSRVAYNRRSQRQFRALAI